MSFLVTAVKIREVAIQFIVRQIQNMVITNQVNIRFLTGNEFSPFCYDEMIFVKSNIYVFF